MGPTVEELTRYFANRHTSQPKRTPKRTSKPKPKRKPKRQPKRKPKRKHNHKPKPIAPKFIFKPAERNV